MHEHKECEHEHKYCSKCDVVYCEKCGKEWKYQPVIWHYNGTYTTDGTIPTPSVHYHTE